MIEYDKERMVETYNDLLMEYAEKDPRLVVVENDLSHANGTHIFGEKYPKRYFNVGIAEANSICVSAGLAAEGYVPFVASLVTFITRRCYDQIVLSVAYSGLNVKVVGTRPGVVCEQNGGTHFGQEDMGIMRNIPGFMVVDACDCTSLRKLFPQILNVDAPVYLRICAGSNMKVYSEDDVVTLGKANVVKKGRDLTVIASDVMVEYAFLAQEILEKEGIDIEIVDMHTVKPLDTEAILKAAEKGPILAAENHSVINGLGSAVSEVLAENGCPVKFKRFGIQDRFGVVGWKKDISEELKVTPEDMAEAIRNLLK